MAEFRDEPLSVDEVRAAVASPAAGAIALFVGTVRDHDQGRGVCKPAYSAHPSGAAELAQVAEKVAGRSQVRALAAVHRVGDLEIGDIAVVVAAAADHRDEAFAACRALIEDVKSDVPVWKHQRYADGQSEWVNSAKPGDLFGRSARVLWPGPGRITRRGITLLVAGAGVVAALAVAVLLPVPYVALTPGPTLNTLGSLSGKPLIQMSGHKTFPTRGHLNMVTVSFIGGPQSNFNVFAALRSWLTPRDAVVPEEEIFTPGQSQQQVLQQDTEQMVSSQQTATAAALCQLNISFKTVDTIQVVEKHRPAAGVLRRGDVITAVDGTPVTCRHDAATMIRDRKPGAPVTLTVLRGGTSRPVTLHTATSAACPRSAC